MKPNPLLTMIRDLQCRVAALEKSQGVIYESAGQDVACVAEVARNLCCDIFKVSSEHIRSRDRHEYIAWPRQVAIYLTLKISGGTLTRVAECFGFDHGNIVHARDRVQDRMDTEALVRRQVEFLEGEMRKLFPEREAAA